MALASVHPGVGKVTEYLADSGIFHSCLWAKAIINHDQYMLSNDRQK